jgi:alpha-N-arabinofuranosidase
MVRLGRSFTIAVLGIVAAGVCVACLPGSSAATSAPQMIASVEAFTARIVVSGDGSRPVNRGVLGNNVVWNEGGERLLRGNDIQWHPEMLRQIVQIPPTVLRYPGGTNADFYEWRNGIGPLSSRRENATLTGRRERIRLGTDEFLELAGRFGSEPLITVNVGTGTPQQAAAWVEYTNRRRGASGPPVRYWEIGNEPYLAARFPEARVEPRDFAARADATIRAMKAVDPSIRVGLPHRNDTLGGVKATDFPGFSETVLRTVTAPYEYVALHSSYFPVLLERGTSTDDIFLATMASTETIREDFDATRAMLRAFAPGRDVKLAVTEYNALYSLDILTRGLLSLVTSRTDRYIESLAGALFVADSLRVFAETDDLLFACFWSISGNWYFGALDHSAKPRPAFYVLEAYDRVLRGRQLRTIVTAPTFASPRVGFSPPRLAVPLIAAIATREGDTVRLAVINKHSSEAGEVTIELPEGAVADSAQWRELNGSNPFGRAVSWTRRNATAQGRRVVITPAAHSFNVVEITLR